jgi:hypothetical protein
MSGDFFMLGILFAVFICGLLVGLSVSMSQRWRNKLLRRRKGLDFRHWQQHRKDIKHENTHTGN